MKKLITAILFFLAFQNFYSQEWELVATATNGDRYFMKREKLNSYGKPKVWTKLIQKSTYYYKGNKKIPIYNATTMRLDEYDCSDKSYRRISLIVYNSKGNVVESNDYDDYEWNNVAPETVAEALLNFVCANIN